MDILEFKISSKLQIWPYINGIDILTKANDGYMGMEADEFFPLNGKNFFTLKSDLILGICNCGCQGCYDYVVQIKYMTSDIVVLYDYQTEKIYSINLTQYKAAICACQNEYKDFVKRGWKTVQTEIKKRLFNYIYDLLEYSETSDGLKFCGIADNSSTSRVIVNYGKGDTVRQFVIDEWMYDDDCFCGYDYDYRPDPNIDVPLCKRRIASGHLGQKNEWFKRIKLFEQVTLKNNPDVLNLALDIAISNLTKDMPHLLKSIRVALLCNSDNAKIVSLLQEEDVRYELLLSYCDDNVSDWSQIERAICKIRGLQKMLLPWLIKNNKTENYINKWLSGTLTAEVMNAIDLETRGMPTPALISRALDIAVKAHEEQVDKGGNPYIWHPVRVALHSHSDEEKIAALLHDVIEDTSVTMDDLAKAGFSEKVLDAIQCLTKKEGEEYMDFIQRVSGNEIAAKVKIQDLNDNMDVSRLNGRKPSKMDTYKQALDYLTEHQNY